MHKALLIDLNVTERRWQNVVKLNLGLPSYILIDLYDLILMNDFIFSARFWFSCVFLHVFVGKNLLLPCKWVWIAL